MGGLKLLIQMDPEAQEYILQNGKSAMVILGSLRGCCGGVSPVPKIYLGPPQDPRGYEENKVGEVTLFVDKNLGDLEAIRVTHAKFLSLHKLSVELV